MELAGNRQRARAGLFQHAARIVLPERPHRNHAEDECRHDRRRRGEREGAAVDRRFLQPRDPVRQDSNDGGQTPPRDHETRDGAGRRDERAFDEELARQPPAACPDRPRIATSPRLADARARNRWATFAQAIRRTKPAAARRTMSGRVALPTIFSFSGIILSGEAAYAGWQRSCGFEPPRGPPERVRRIRLPSASQ